MNTKDACLISVIVPAYNVESYIEECIISILNQSYENIEVIIVNDGSTDKTGIICESLSNIDERICYYSQNNKGVSEARNKGLEAASGEYVMFVDGDDYIAPDCIEYLLSIVKKTNAEFCFSINCFTKNKGKQEKLIYLHL
jgi:glycosyltransferase involved in cell wall biosynthesis